MEGHIQSTLLHLDPVEGKLTEELTPPLDLASLLVGYTVDSIFSSEGAEKISLKQICEQVAQHVEEPHKVENFIHALVDPDLATQVCGDDHHQCDDPAELKRILDEEHISEGFAILDRVEDLQHKYALATRKIQFLEFIVWDLTEKIKLLEYEIGDAKTHREQEQDEALVVLFPMRSIYLREFHDQVREGIAEKLSATALHVRNQRALRYIKEVRVYDEERIVQNNLWWFMREMHGVCPEVMWNQFVDELLGDEELVALLGLSPQAILITRFGSPDEQQQMSSHADTASALLRNKHVFAELVTRQDEEQRPSYSELFQFLFNSAPETMNFKAICSPGHENRANKLNPFHRKSVPQQRPKLGDDRLIKFGSLSKLLQV